MDVYVEIYEKGNKYTSSLTIRVCGEDRTFIEDILLDNKLAYRVTSVEVEDEDGAENW